MATADRPLAEIAAAPFTVLVDQREKLPYTFDSLPPKRRWACHRLIVTTVTTTLATGDYTIAGLEGRFAIERKSLEDLYGTVGQHRERFEAELERLDAMQFSAVVVEATVAEAWHPARHRPDWISRLSPRALEASVVAWAIRFPRVHWWHVGGRREGEVRTFEAMEQFWMYAQHEGRQDD